MTGRPELRALTSARGVAAWMVVLYHIRLAIPGLPPSALHLLAQGYLAVDFFFLLSGFVIWMTWSDRLRTRGLAEVPAFLRKRVARIWPLHLVMLAFALALALLLAATGRHDARAFPFAELPLHVVLMQNWGFTHALSWNNPSWSISTELAAYLAFPALVLAIDWRRVPSWVVVTAIAALFVLLHAVYAAAGAPTLGDRIAALGLVRCLIEFTAGTAIGALWWRWRGAPLYPAFAAGVLAVVAIGAILLDRVPSLVGAPPALAAALLALALTSTMRRNPLNAAPFHYLGEISYATYLSHFLLFAIFKLAFVDDPQAIPPLLLGLYLAMVLGCSVALYHLVERPAQRWVNGLRLPFDRAGTGTNKQPAHS